MPEPEPTIVEYFLRLCCPEIDQIAEAYAWVAEHPIRAEDLFGE